MTPVQRRYAPIKGWPDNFGMSGRISLESVAEFIGMRNTDDFENVSRLLSNSELTVCDFESSINQADVNDLVFIDPPYTVKHNNNGFVKYNETLFSWDDQIRLRDAVIRAANRGALVLVTNAKHQSIKELYRGVGEHMVLQRHSVLAGNSAFRKATEELAIRCWP